MLKTISLMAKVTPKTFIEDYLKANGIEDTQMYLNPDFSCFDKPEDYPNIEAGLKCFEKHLESKSKIGVLVDSDNDGQSSAAIMCNFLIKLGLEYHKDIIPFLHTAKQHGLRATPTEDIVKQVLQKEVKLLIIPDASTNDKEECSLLKSNGVDIIILDHHEVTTDNPDAIVINHHLTEGLNVDLPGAGVTFKFIQYYCSKHNIETPYYYDLVASSIVSDVCSLRSLENRAFLNIGLGNEDKRNPMLNLIYEKACKRGVNPEGLAWGANPLVNSLCRSDNQEDKLIFFDALVTGENIQEGLKVANRAHRHQSNEVKKIMTKLDPTLDLSHKAIIGFLNPENKNYIGLVANKVMTTYNKPTILLREKNKKEWSGSLRSRIPLLTKINDTKLGVCVGHEYACGVTAQREDLQALIDWLDTLDLSVAPAVPVTAELSVSQISAQLGEQVNKWKILWGERLPKPTWTMDITVNPRNVYVFRKKTITIKTNYKGIDILLFSAKEDDVTAFKKGGKCKIIFDININTWNNVVKPQCVVTKYEFINEENNEDNWEDDF